MSETKTLTVYELAKELGLDSISLLDKLKALNIKVKSHMSELSEGEADQARVSLSPKAKGSKTTATSKAASGTKATAAKDKDSADKPVKKTAVKKKATAAKTETAPTPTPEAAVATTGKTASPIIRRRTKDDGQTETLSPPLPGSRAAAPTPEQQEELDQQTYEAEQQAYLEAEAAQFEEPAYEATPSTGLSQELVNDPVAAANAADAETASVSPDTQSDLPSGVPAPVAKAPRAPIVLAPRPVAPRRSILKVVEIAARRKIPLVCINADPSPFTELTESLDDGLVLLGTAGEHVPRIVERLRRAR